MMTLTQQIITIAAVVLATMVTRFLPFLIFPSGKPTPKYIRYLGKVLPAAVFGLLIAYCLKNASIFSKLQPCFLDHLDIFFVISRSCKHI